MSSFLPGWLKFSWLPRCLPHLYANPIWPVKHHGSVTCTEQKEHKSPCNTIHRSSWRFHTLLRVWVVHLADRTSLPWPFCCPCSWPPFVSHLVRLNQYMHCWAEKSSLGIDVLSPILSPLALFSCRREGGVLTRWLSMRRESTVYSDWKVYFSYLLFSMLLLPLCSNCSSQRSREQVRKCCTWQQYGPASSSVHGQHFVILWRHIVIPFHHVKMRKH